MKLSELNPGQTAVITTIHEGQYSLRIMELGLVVGAKVSFDSKAPMGDPIAFSLGNSKISMRKTDANMVEVEPIK
jgi:Fe2+ transport system protein FeoA